MRENHIKNSLSLRLIVTFFVLQVIFAFIVLPMLSYQTIFPFSTWNLFGSPPRTHSVPLIYIRQVNIQQFEPAIEGHKYFRSLESNRNYHQAHDIMSHEVGRMHQGKDTGFSLVTAERVARIFWGSKDDVKFEIRLARVNTVDFFINDSVIEYNTLGAFHFRNNALVSVDEALGGSL